MSRVSKTQGSIQTKPRKARRRYRCDGHLAGGPHYIQPGDLIVWSALPPGDSDIGNTCWLHARFCSDCWPEGSET